MTDKTLPILHIERKPNSKKARVAGHGITVPFLVSFIDDPDWPMERICDEYGLTPAQVYAAWSYYYDHKNEIDQIIEEDSEALDHLAADPGYRARIEALKRKKQLHSG